MAKLNLKDTDNTFIITDNKEVTDMTASINFAEDMANVINSIQDRYEARATTVTKSNGVKLTGISMKFKDRNYGPMIYVDDQYRRWLDGEQLTVVAAEVISIADRSPQLPPIDMDLKFESVRDKLRVKVLELARNAEYLEDKPYRFCGAGLAMVAFIDLGEYGIAVNESIAEANDYDIPEMFEDALNNMRLSARLTSMESALWDKADGNLLNEDPVEDVDGLFVLTNDSTHLGASVLFCDGMLERVAYILGGVSFFALPSSIHEFIIIPDIGQFEAEDLKQMVVSANRSVVEDRDILSDNVYRYDVEDEVFSVAA